MTEDFGSEGANHMGQLLKIELTDDQAARLEVFAQSWNMTPGEFSKSVLNRESFDLACVKRLFESKDGSYSSSIVHLLEEPFASCDRPDWQVELLVELLNTMDQSQVRRIFSELIASDPHLRRVIDSNAESTSLRKPRSEANSERIMDQKAELYRRLAK